MSLAPKTGLPSAPIPKEAPRAPTGAEWAAMDEAQRDAAVDALIDSVSEEELAEREAMAEGDPHLDAKVRARDTLRRYFHGIHRSIYIGADIKVYYPGEKGFTPDLIAVADVAPRKRWCWMVSREGKGVDLALEVHDRGEWKKDFVDNVARYARLGIREYFIFDVGREELTGYRLPDPAAGAYQPLTPERERFHSEVLGLDLVVQGGDVGFYHGTALLLRLDQMLSQEQRRARRARTQVKQIRTRLKSERTRVKEEQARVKEEQARAREEQARAQQAAQGLGEAIISILGLRRIELSAQEREQILTCHDPEVLGRWQRAALTISTAAQLFE